MSGRAALRPDALLSWSQPAAVPVPAPERRPPIGLLVHGFDLAALIPGALVGAGAADDWVVVLLAVLIAAPLLLGGDEPGSRLRLGALEEVPRLLTCIGIPLLLITAVAVPSGSQEGVLLQAAVTAVALPAARALSYAVLRGARRRGRLPERAIVVGRGVVGVELERALRRHPELGLRVVGFIDGPPLEQQLSLDGFDDDPEAPPLLGDITDIEDVLERLQVRRVIVAFGSRREHELVDVLRRLALLDADIHVVPRFFDIGVAPATVGVDDVWGIPVYRAPRSGRLRRTWAVKRALDVVVAGAVLLVSLPLLLLLAVAVRLSGPGGALFRQERLGHDDRPFRILKLRSLHEPRCPTNDAAASVSDTPDQLDVQAARRRDVESRRTRVGELARRTCLDELPQLWNVIAGDMSLVGPRPEEVPFARSFSETVPGYRERHRFPMGLTGWAQVNGLRGPTSIAERARFDNNYIEHWSLWRDVVILLRTIGAVGRSALNRLHGHEQVDVRRVDQDRDEPATSA